MSKNKNIAELKSKITFLIDKKFQGDPKKAFAYYDDLKRRNNKIDKNSLLKLLTDANVGNFFTRKKWVEGIFKKIDTDRDNEISWNELVRVLQRR